MTTFEILQAAKASAPSLAAVDTEQKNNALLAMADALEANCAAILAENAQDMAAAKDHLSQSMLDVCDQTALIPMSEHCESLNAAAAATVLLWEAARND